MEKIKHMCININLLLIISGGPQHACKGASTSILKVNVNVSKSRLKQKSKNKIKDKIDKNSQVKKLKLNKIQAVKTLSSQAILLKILSSYHFKSMKNILEFFHLELTGWSSYQESRFLVSSLPVLCVLHTLCRVDSRRTDWVGVTWREWW